MAGVQGEEATKVEERAAAMRAVKAAGTVSEGAVKVRAAVLLAGAREAEVMATKEEETAVDERATGVETVWEEEVMRTSHAS